MDDLEQLSGQLREARADLKRSQEHLAKEVVVRRQLELQWTKADQERDTQRAEEAKTALQNRVALEAEVDRLQQTSKTEVRR